MPLLQKDYRKDCVHALLMSWWRSDVGPPTSPVCPSPGFGGAGPVRGRTDLLALPYRLGPMLKNGNLALRTHALAGDLKGARLQKWQFLVCRRLVRTVSIFCVAFHDWCLLDLGLRYRQCCRLCTAHNGKICYSSCNSAWRKTGNLITRELQSSPLSGMPGFRIFHKWRTLRTCKVIFINEMLPRSLAVIADSGSSEGKADSLNKTLCVARPQLSSKKLQVISQYVFCYFTLVFYLNSGAVLHSKFWLSCLSYSLSFLLH